MFVGKQSGKLWKRGLTFGNVRRNTLRDSRTNVVNFAAFKTANISSTLKVEFHIDFLNAFNHSNPASIDPFVDDAGLASESSGFANPHVQASGSRSIWFGLKILF